MRVRTFLAVACFDLNTARLNTLGSDKAYVRNIAFLGTRIDCEPSLRSKLAAHVNLPDQAQIGTFQKALFDSLRRAHVPPKIVRQFEWCKSDC